MHRRPRRNFLERSPGPRHEHLRWRHAYQRIAKAIETHHRLSRRVNLLVFATKGNEGLLAVCKGETGCYSAIQGKPEMWMDTPGKFSLTSPSFEPSR